MYSEKAVHSYLKEEIFPQLSLPPYGQIEVSRLVSSKSVYLFIKKENSSWQ